MHLEALQLVSILIALAVVGLFATLCQEPPNKNATHGELMFDYEEEENGRR